jgi:hypothetical protein
MKKNRRVGYIFITFFAVFGECRQAQRNIVGSIYNCKMGPGGAASKEDAALQLNATNK